MEILEFTEENASSEKKMCRKQTKDIKKRV